MKTVTDREAWLLTEINELRATVQDLEAALYAAVDGSIEPAERYIAAGVLGLRKLDGQGVVMTWYAPLVLPSTTMDGPYYITCTPWLPQNASRVQVVRLYVESEVAPHFALHSVQQDATWIILEGRSTNIPCELFSKRHGSPRVDWTFEQGNSVTAKVVNTSNETRMFRMFGLGYWHQAR